MCLSLTGEACIIVQRTLFAPCLAAFLVRHAGPIARRELTVTMQVNLIVSICVHLYSKDAGVEFSTQYCATIEV